MSTSARAAEVPRWYWIAAGLGLAWSGFGVFQFMATALASRQELMAGGMTEAQAALYAALPGWMNAAFALGVFGGLLGSALLLLRHKQATWVLAASLAGYCVLYLGDITQGVFAIMGSGQVIVLSIVVLIAVALLWLARHAGRHFIQA